MRFFVSDNQKVIDWLTKNVGPVQNRKGITEFTGSGWYMVSGTYFPSGKKPILKFCDIKIDDERVAVWFTLVWS